MSCFGVVRLKQVLAMLEDCAPGFAIKQRPHNYCVTYRGRSFPRLPRGAHGSKNPEIETGHIKQMARQLGIEQCAKDHLPQL